MDTKEGMCRVTYLIVYFIFAAALLGSYIAPERVGEAQPVRS